MSYMTHELVINIHEVGDGAEVPSLCYSARGFYFVESNGKEN